MMNAEELLKFSILIFSIGVSLAIKCSFRLFSSLSGKQISNLVSMKVLEADVIVLLTVDADELMDKEAADADRVAVEGVLLFKELVAKDEEEFLFWPRM